MIRSFKIGDPFISARLSETVLGQPGNCLFDQIGDVCSVGRNDSLLLQTLAEINMLDLRNGVFQIVVVIRKPGFG